MTEYCIEPYAAPGPSSSVMNGNRSVLLWLGILAALVFCMVLLGGAVRLTGSGLSMVDWRPIMGVVPPISGNQWMQAFDAYKQFPEFRFRNSHFNLGEFKFIFWMEYAHRLLGRVLGIVFIVPFFWFLYHRRIPGPLQPRLWALLGLGALQGLIGWYMVQSGLVDNPAVSQYRLALHLLIAVIIYAYLLRLIIGLRADAQQLHAMGLRDITVIALILLMIGSGALVAGTHAGHIFNTYPKMGESWIPAQLFVLTPAWRNFFENTVTIQFIHRNLAILVVVAVLYYGSQLRSKTSGNRIFMVLAFTVIVQAALGISTLLLRVPPVLGVAHQAGALVLLSAVVYSAVHRHVSVS